MKAVISRVEWPIVYTRKDDSVSLRLWAVISTLYLPANGWMLLFCECELAQTLVSPTFGYNGISMDVNSVLV